MKNEKSKTQIDRREMRETLLAKNESGRAPAERRE